MDGGNGQRSRRCGSDPRGRLPDTGETSPGPVEASPVGTRHRQGREGKTSHTPSGTCRGPEAQEQTSARQPSVAETTEHTRGPRGDREDPGPHRVSGDWTSRVETVQDSGPQSTVVLVLRPGLSTRREVDLRTRCDSRIPGSHHLGLTTRGSPPFSLRPHHRTGGVSSTVHPVGDPRTVPRTPVRPRPPESQVLRVCSRRLKRYRPWTLCPSAVATRGTGKVSKGEGDWGQFGRHRPWRDVTPKYSYFN